MVGVTKPGGRTRAAGPRTLTIDIGGSGLKAAIVDRRGALVSPRARIDTPYPCPPLTLLGSLDTLTMDLGSFDRVSVGFPGVVRDGKIITAPHFDTASWAGFDFATAVADRWHKPVRLINDAELQGFGVIGGKGLELVLTLGTGAGTALYRDGILMPHLEFAHHPVHGQKTYNAFIGEAARAKIGNRKWNKRVRRVIETLFELLHYDRLYLGGGNSARISGDLPASTTLVSNDAAFPGGLALWRDSPNPPGKAPGRNAL